MDISQQNQAPTPENQSHGEQTEKPLINPEVAPEVPKTPELKPEMAPEPSKEQVGANPSQAQPVQPDPIQPAVKPVSDDKELDLSTADLSEKETTELDKKYVQATDVTIDQLEDKPFEEEEAHEDLQIGYLRDRFGKILKKSKDE